MKTRSFPKQFDTVQDLGYSNLVVGGCSFTYNNHDDSAVTWPYYLRDLGNFQEVYDCSLPGAGNNHIKNSVMYFLDNNKQLINEKTLVMVGWSGNDRDDQIVTEDSLDNDMIFEYKFEDEVYTGFSGGISGYSNLKNKQVFDSIKTVKNQKTRSIENYINIRSLYTYLQCSGLDFVFFEFRDPNLPALDNNFDIAKFLTPDTKTIYNSMIHKWSTDMYTYCVKNDLLFEDDYHPSPTGHLEYTKQILLPELRELLSKT